MNSRKNTTVAIFQSLLRQHVADTDNEGIDDLSMIDPDYLLYLLDEYRLILTLYPLIKKQAILTQSLLIQLTKCSHDLLTRHFQQQKWILWMAKAFDQQQIKYAFLKGPVLNQQLYGIDVKRYSKDIDLLIVPEDLRKAHECLVALGLRLNLNDLSVNQYEALTFSEQALVKDFSYTDRSGKIEVELHLNAFISARDARLNPHSSLAQVQFMSHAIAVLPAEENFLFLAVHAARHHWERLQWLVDLAEFYKKIPFNWQKVCLLAQSQGFGYALFANKILLKECFDIHLPPLPASLFTRFCAAMQLKFARKHWEHMLTGTVKKKRAYHIKLHCVRLLFYYQTRMQKKTHLKMIFFQRRMKRFMRK